MKKTIFFSLVILIIIAGCMACGTKESNGTIQKKLTLDTEKEKISYSIGFNIGNSVKSVASEVTADTLLQGFRDGMNSQQPQLPPHEIQAILKNYQQNMRQRMLKERTILGEKNRVEGETFLAENAKKEGVKATKSGLQYKILVQGKGAKPKITDQVKVNYRGTIINGTEFDSSQRKGGPQTFKLNEMIPGFSEGVQMMGVGSKIQLFIPSNLAYGSVGRGNIVGPNCLLIFEIELLEISKAEAAKTPAKNE